jgi:hypothetical protein
MVVHACNPSYSGRGHRRIEAQVQPSKSQKPYVKNKLGMVVYAFIPATQEAEVGRV